MLTPTEDGCERRPLVEQDGRGKTALNGGDARIHIPRQTSSLVHDGQLGEEVLLHAEREVAGLAQLPQDLWQREQLLRTGTLGALKE